MEPVQKLNSDELMLLQDANVLRIKNSALDKVFNILASAMEDLKTVAPNYSKVVPEAAILFHGKVSRGENHLGLPYQVLDYPATFALDDIFAFRTMVWWGNFYSCTLHIQGKHLFSLKEIILNNVNSISKSGIYVSCGDSPWNYDYNKENYKLASELETIDLDDRFFLKLSQKFELEDLHRLSENCLASFDQFMKIISY